MGKVVLNTKTNNERASVFQSIGVAYLYFVIEQHVLTTNRKIMLFIVHTPGSLGTS